MKRLGVGESVVEEVQVRTTDLYEGAFGRKKKTACLRSGASATNGVRNDGAGERDRSKPLLHIVRPLLPEKISLGEGKLEMVGYCHIRHRQTLISTRNGRMRGM